MIEHARAHETPPNLTYVCADATTWRPDRPFDVIVLSNVLEHLERRTAFLKRLLAAARPKKVLIRVPMKERDWLVPLQDELSVDSRLDPGHRIEHTRAELLSELDAAGLRVNEFIVRFGEYLCACTFRNEEAAP